MKKMLSISIIGNIGVGKTTLMRKLQEEKTWSKKPYFVEEPVEEWKEQGLLQKYYEDPHKWALPFQILALTSRITKAWEAPPGTAIMVTDNHWVVDRQVFAQANLSADPDGLQAYEYAWKCLTSISSFPPLYNNIIIYLKATPEICMERVKARNRPEEMANLSLEYLKCLDKHFKKLSKDPVEHFGNPVCFYSFDTAKQSADELCTSVWKSIVATHSYQDV